MAKLSKYWRDQYKNEKGTRESVSGVGSTLENTKEIRAALPVVIEQYRIKTIVDIPCGDWHWMKEVDLSSVRYLGCDIVPEMIIENKIRYEKANITFCVRNALTERSEADLIICRDFLFHLSDKDIRSVLNNFKAKYLMLTSFPNEQQPEGGLWRKIDVETYGVGKPIYVIQENDTPACQGRIVGVYTG